MFVPPFVALFVALFCWSAKSAPEAVEGPNLILNPKFHFRNYSPSPTTHTELVKVGRVPPWKNRIIMEKLESSIEMTTLSDFYKIIGSSETDDQRQTHYCVMRDINFNIISQEGIRVKSGMHLLRFDVIGKQLRSLDEKVILFITMRSEMHQLYKEAHLVLDGKVNQVKIEILLTQQVYSMKFYIITRDLMHIIVALTNCRLHRYSDQGQFHTAAKIKERPNFITNGDFSFPKITHGDKIIVTKDVAAPWSVREGIGLIVKSKNYNPLMTEDQSFAFSKQKQHGGVSVLQNFEAILAGKYLLTFDYNAYGPELNPKAQLTVKVNSKTHAKFQMKNFKEEKKHTFSTILTLTKIMNSLSFTGLKLRYEKSGFLVSGVSLYAVKHQQEEIPVRDRSGSLTLLDEKMLIKAGERPSRYSLRSVSQGSFSSSFGSDSQDLGPNLVHNNQFDKPSLQQFVARPIKDNQASPWFIKRGVGWIVNSQTFVEGFDFPQAFMFAINQQGVVLEQEIEVSQKGSYGVLFYYVAIKNQGSTKGQLSFSINDHRKWKIQLQQCEEKVIQKYVEKIELNPGKVKLSFIGKNFEEHSGMLMSGVFVQQLNWVSKDDSELHRVQEESDDEDDTSSVIENGCFEIPPLKEGEERRVVKHKDAVPWSVESGSVAVVRSSIICRKFHYQQAMFFGFSPTQIRVTQQFSVEEMGFFRLKFHYSSEDRHDTKQGRVRMVINSILVFEIELKSLAHGRQSTKSILIKCRDGYNTISLEAQGFRDRQSGIMISGINLKEQKDRSGSESEEHKLGEAKGGYSSSPDSVFDSPPGSPSMSSLRIGH